MAGWTRYWSAEGGRLAAAILRIGIALAVWLSLVRMHGTWPANAPGAPSPPDVYRPVGVWMLLGGEPPASSLIDALWWVARASTLAMLVGAASRVATAVSFVSSVSLASLYYSGFPGWSHTFNVVFLAQLAFLGARGGDALSLDALVRRLRGLPPLRAVGGYAWSIRLVQVAVAVMFASGMFHKVVQGHVSLAWALSDNLRHQLVVRFDLAGLERTVIADWLIDDVVRYRIAATLNLIAQTLPLLACVLVRRPLLRAACGLFFVIETLALGLVMDLWNLHWLPLAVVFVDWDALAHRLGRAPTGPSGQASPPASTRVLRARLVFVSLFVAYDVITAFVPRIDQRLNTYPFSGFPMFANVRARRPYDTHQPYALAGGQFQLVASAPLPAEATRWIDHAYRRTFGVRDAEELRRRLASILADVRRLYPAVTGVRCIYTVFEVPAYPAPARLVRRPVATLGELHQDGTFRSFLGASEPAGLTAVEYYPPAQATPGEVVTAAPWRLSQVGRGAVVVVIAGERWLVRGGLR